MAGKRFRAELEIIMKLPEAEAGLAQGQKVTPALEAKLPRSQTPQRGSLGVDFKGSRG